MEIGISIYYFGRAANLDEVAAAPPRRGAICAMLYSCIFVVFL
jgi:hypothetical protein